jgi:DNA helicase-2/ATP-dependent DNA helicase PcrA
VLGDIAQAVHGYKGLNSWKELSPIFGDQLKRVEMTKNFRSTREIVLFSNEVLKQVKGAATKLAQPVAREGKRPTISQAIDIETMCAQVADDLRALLSSDQELKNIALITKTDSDSREVEKQLAQHGIKADQVITLSGSRKNVTYNGGVVILPASLSKGIEFQAVFVIQANNDTYNKAIPYDGRLLYVAITRALHQLNIYYTGNISGFLSSLENVADM